MNGLEDVFLGLIVAVVGGLVVTGGVLGWIAFFQVRKLRQEQEEALAPRSAMATPVDTVPAPVPAVLPASPPPLAEPAATTVPAEKPAAAIINRPPRSLPDWQGRLLENWTGLVGLAVVLLGLGFLAVYGAAVLNPFGRFLLIVAAAVVSVAGGIALVKYQPQWTRWGYWLQSFGAAVFLIACLGSGGIPGVAWVQNPVAGLALLLLGVAVNIALGSYRRRQPYLTLHVVLSLLALSVAEPTPLLVLALWTTAFLGLALSWFQRWAYHRVVTVVVAQALLAAAYWRAAPDPALHWLALGASASLAILVHIASYRRLEAETWSRPAFVTHVLNALAAALPCALWAPRLPFMEALALTAVFAGLVLLSLRSKGTGTTWLYRTDRVLALAVSGVVMLVNPLDTPPVIIGSVFVLLAVALAWSARAEGDTVLARIGLAVMTVSLGLVAAASLTQYRLDTGPWLWQTGAVFLAAALAAAYLATDKQRGQWHEALEALLPPAFLIPLAVLWFGERSPLTGFSPGWLLLVPAVALALLARLGRGTLAWSLVITAAVAVFGDWCSWLGQGNLWGTPLPTLVWGAGSTLVTMAAVAAFTPRTRGFLAAALLALGSLALLTWLTLVPVHPAVALLALSALFIAVLLIDLGRFHRLLAPAAAAVIAGMLAIARLVWAIEAPVGWIALGSDLLAAGLLAAAAFHRRTGPGFFIEGSLVWLAWTVWFDLPGEWLALGLGVIAVGALAAGRVVGRKRIDWYSLVPFLLSAVVCLTTGRQVSKGLALVAQIIYIVIDAHWRQTVETRAWAKPLRRYVLVFVQAAVLAISLPTFFLPNVLTLGWSIEAALVFFLAVTWKDEVFKNAALAGLGVCLIRLIWVDLSNSDILTKAVTFLCVGGLMVGMNLLYLWSKKRQ